MVESLVIEGVDSRRKSAVTDLLAWLIHETQIEFGELIQKKIILKKKIVMLLILAGMCAGVQESVLNVAREKDVDLTLLHFIPLVLAAYLLIRAGAVFHRFRHTQFSCPVDRIGTARLNFTLYPFEHGSALVDEDQISFAVPLSYPSLADPAAAERLAAEYDALVSNLPVVLPAENPLPRQNYRIFGHESSLHRIYEALEYAYRDVRRFDTVLGMVKADHELAEYIIGHLGSLAEATQRPCNSTTRDILLRVSGIVHESSDQSNTKGLIDIDSFSLNLAKTISSNLIKMHSLRKQTLIAKVAIPTGRLADITSYRAYTFYCPFCHESQLQRLMTQDYSVLNAKSVDPIRWNRNARMRLIDWRTERWRCQLCERETEQPLPVHRIYDEVLLPAYNLLLHENEHARGRLYADLRQKIIEYRERAERDHDEILRANRREIDEETSKLRMFDAQAESCRQTIDSMKTLLMKLKAVREERMEAIERYALNLREQIRRESEEIERSVRDDVTRINSQTTAVIESLAQLARVEQVERDEVMLNVAAAVVDLSRKAEAQITLQEQMAASLSGIEKSTRTSAAVDLARARRQGLDQHAWFRIDKSISGAIADVASALAGHSEIDAAAQRIGKA